MKGKRLSNFVPNRRLAVQDPTRQLSIGSKQAMLSEPSRVSIQQPSPTASDQYMALKFLANVLIKETAAMSTAPVRGVHNVNPRSCKGTHVSNSNRPKDSKGEQF